MTQTVNRTVLMGAPQLLRSLRFSKPATHDDMVGPLKAMQKSYNAVGVTSTIDASEGPKGSASTSMARWASARIVDDTSR